jgi:tRNA pseudouridine38-40 synthase
MRYKLLIAYEGTHYHGWQVQFNGISIQQRIEEALSVILRHPAKITGSGRTDAGVHALGQTAHFDSDSQLDVHAALHSLNGLLPSDIRILSISEVAADFHARYSAKGKIYRYHLYLERVLNPFRRNFVWHVPFIKDLNAMRKAASLFTGTHDFTSFANEAHRGTASYDSVRRIDRIDFIQEKGGIALEFEGEGFLYMMVRNMVGILVEVGAGKRQPESIADILLLKDRKSAGQAAPARGLFLVKVLYEGLPQDS